jgi:uncharacterized RDD family membrane protein YckC
MPQGWSITYVVVWLTYDIGFVAKLRQTPGTMACGVKIVALDDAPVTFQHAVLRHMLGILTHLCFIFFPVGTILHGPWENRALLRPVTVSRLHLANRTPCA